MIDAGVASEFYPSFDRPRLRRGPSLRALTALAALASSVISGCWFAGHVRPAGSEDAARPGLVLAIPAMAMPRPAPRAEAVPPPAAALLAPGFSFGLSPAPLAATFVYAPAAAVPPAAAVASATPAAKAVAGAILPAAPAPPVVAVAQADATPAAEAPLPLPRPPELGAPSRPAEAAASPERPPARGRARAPSRAARANAGPAAEQDGGTFVDRFFGLFRPSGPGAVLAYAAPGDDLLGRGGGMTGPATGFGRSVAVYDIAAHTVFMPDGSRLEAHSGLGDLLDDPGHVHIRNRGATPPHVYDLTLRESLFHGVQALRLNPVGGGGVFGRNGLLAHTYMLGPNGDSNGCVSFRDYAAFLRAYQRGEVRRLVVVSGRA